MTTHRVTLIANPSTPLPEELAGAEVEVLGGPQTITIQNTLHSWYYVCAQVNADGSHTLCHPACTGPHYQGFMRLETEAERGSRMKRTREAKAPASVPITEETAKRLMALFFPRVRP